MRGGESGPGPLAVELETLGWWLAKFSRFMKTKAISGSLMIGHSMKIETDRSYWHNDSPNRPADSANR